MHSLSSKYRPPRANKSDSWKSQTRPLFVLTASGEVHRMRDGIVAVDGQGDQHVRRRERNHGLQEPDYLA